MQRVAAGGINEVILALSTTMEGDTTNFYIYRKLEKLGVMPSALETPGMLHLRVLDGSGTVLNEKTFVQSTVLSEAE